MRHIDIHTQRSYLHLFPLLLLLSPYFTRPCASFASYLVDKRSSCYLDLREPDEIIMNAPLIPSGQSAHGQDVYLEVFAYDDTKKLNSVEVHVDPNADDRKVVYVPPPPATSSDSTMETLYSLKLRSPQSLQDLQFVMDVKIHPYREEDDFDAPPPPPDAAAAAADATKDGEQRPSAKFTGSTSGCNRKRAYGRARDKDEGLDLHVQFPPSFFRVGSNNVGKEEFEAVEVLAGWACGHEAVTLTSPIFFVPDPATTTVVRNETNEKDGNPTVRVENPGIDTVRRQQKQQIVKPHPDEERANTGGRIHVDKGKFPEQMNVVMDNLKKSKDKNDVASTSMESTMGIQSNNLRAKRNKHDRKRHVNHNDNKDDASLKNPNVLLERLHKRYQNHEKSSTGGSSTFSITTWIMMGVGCMAGITLWRRERRIMQKKGRRD